MQKWEYCEVEVIIGGRVTGMKAEGAFFRPSGKHENFKGKHADIFAELGEDGWEAVAASARTGTGIGSKHKINYIFKRPKTDSDGD